MSVISIRSTNSNNRPNLARIHRNLAKNNQKTNPKTSTKMTRISIQNSAKELI